MQKDLFKGITHALWRKVTPSKREGRLSPGIRFALIRIILVLKARVDLEFVHMDVKTTFFHKQLDKVIFIDQPEGFVSKGHER